MYETMIEISTREVIYRTLEVSLDDLAEALDRYPEDVLIDIERGSWDEIEAYALQNEEDADQHESDWGLDTVEIL